MNNTLHLLHDTTFSVLWCIFLGLLIPINSAAQTLSCALSAPVNGATYVAPATVLLTATTTVPAGVTVQKVEFYANGTKIGQDSTSPYLFYWASVANGSYVLTAKVTSTTGAQATSAPRNISVSPPVPPTISLTAPNNNAIFAAGSNIVVSAIATAGTNSSIQRVKFYANSVLLGQDTSSPYSFTWANASQGTYTVLAIAYANNGTSTISASRMITVNAPIPPSVSLTQPTNGSIFTGVSGINLTATASAASGATLTKVEFFSGTTKLGEDTTSPYTYLWSSPPDGISTLSAKATDSNGSITTSAAINITVNNNPTIIVTSPSNNAAFTTPANITIQTVPSTYNGTSVQKVEFFVDANKVGEDTSVPYSYTISSLLVGSYNLTARVTDSNNRQGTSNTATITVNSTTPPTASLTSPSNNSTFIAPANINLTATATPSSGTTIQRVDFYNGTTKIGEDLSAPYEFTWANVTAGSYNLKAIAINNNLQEGTSNTATITVNPTTPPTASLTSPSNNSAFIAPANINLTAIATPSSGTTIQRVDFYNGTTKIGEDLTTPYEFTWANVAAGSYNLKAIAINNNLQEGTSNTATITVNQNQIIPPSVVITQPTANASFFVGDAIPITAQVTSTTTAAYLDVDNTQTGWVKLKIGYNASSLWSPMQNPIASGNNTLEITLKDFDNNANWSLIRLYPQGNTTTILNLATYWAAGQSMGNGWKKITIPLSAFANFNFSSISYIEFPSSNNAGNFHLGIREIKFTGGTNPFVWFGDTNPNISTNAGESSAIPATFVPAATNNISINRVDFYDDNTFLGSDTSAPYSYTWTNAPQGNHTLTAVTVYNGTLTVTSSPINISVLPVPISNTVTITATFTTTPTTWSVQKARLRYNKDFAYSLTLDDGLKDAYSTAFKLLNGGTINENGTNVYYPPLKYTDGCGNDKVFTAASAWNSVNVLGEDNHTGNSANNMLWSDLDEMYAGGWDVLNHSWSHGAYNLTPEQYNYQVTENVNWVRNNTANAIEMTQFVVPSGDSNYYPYAFNNGMKAVYSQFWQNNYQYGFNVSGAVDMNNLLMTRELISDEYMVAINRITDVANNSINGTKYWWADFTHGCSLTSPVTSNIQFSTFKSYMQHIANQYGKNGSDRVWAASLQEVQEYLRVREASIISSSLVGNQLTISLDLSNIPQNLRRYALSFAITANASFSNVQVANCPSCTLSFNGNQWQKQLINLQWQPTNSGAKMATTTHQHQTTANLLPDVVKLQPNPAQNHVLISFNKPLQEQDAVLNFYTQMGQLAAQKTIHIAPNDTQISLNLNELCLEKGIYLVDIEGAIQHFHALKLLKE
jgi:hypothetical protein